MTTIRRLAFLALLSAWMAVPSGCAHAPPVINAVVTCSGNTIPFALVEQVYGDFMAENWGDLATNVVPLLKDGWADIVCIENALKTAHPEMVPHFEKLKAGHVELRVAETSKPDPGDRLPGASPAAGGAPRVPAAGPKMFAYAGESVAAAAERCDRACGGRNRGIGSPGRSCLCAHAGRWHEDQDANR